MSPAEDKVERATDKCSPTGAWLLRAMLHNWRDVHDVTLMSPRAVAEQLLCALDALAIVHGNERETAEMDELLGRTMGGGPRP